MRRLTPTLRRFQEATRNWRMPGPASSERVSVALCTRNGAEYVEEQLKSILSQTVSVSEIVVSDDASSDATLSVVRRVLGEQRDRNVTIIENATPLGVTANFSQAMAACSHELIALSDQDDVWSPQRVEHGLAAFRHRPDALLVASDARLVDATGKDMGRSLFGRLGVTHGMRTALSTPGALDVLLRRNVLTGATMMLRRELARSCAPLPQSWLHDEWLAIWAAIGDGLVVLDEQLIDYRQHGANVVGVPALSAKRAIAKFCEPRTARNMRLLERARELRERVDERVSPERVQKIDAKLEHEYARSRLPRPRASRVVPVIHEWRSGSYGSYGNGLIDAVRDVVQPI